MELRSSILLKSLLGAFIGMLISLTIMFSQVGADYIDSNGLAVLKQIVGSMVYGAIAMGGSAMYEIESWSLARVTATHYILTMSSFFVVNYLLGWFGTGVLLAVAFLGFTVGYVIIWIVQSIRCSREIVDINEGLKHLNRD